MSWQRREIELSLRSGKKTVDALVLDPGYLAIHPYPAWHPGYCLVWEEVGNVKGEVFSLTHVPTGLALCFDAEIGLLDLMGMLEQLQAAVGFEELDKTEVNKEAWARVSEEWWKILNAPRERVRQAAGGAEE